MPLTARSSPGRMLLVTILPFILLTEKSIGDSFIRGCAECANFHEKLEHGIKAPQTSLRQLSCAATL
jgi:hypothetical protein